MGMKERRETEKNAMKKKVMDAAIDIIEEEGYEKLSIRKIAAKIEYSPTTLYLYYKDKSEIIADMSEELYRKVSCDVAAIAEDTSTLPADRRLRQIMRAFIKGLCGEPEMAKAIMYSGLNAAFENECTDGRPSNPGIKMLGQLLADGVSQNAFRPAAANSSWMLISALLGIVLSSIGSRAYQFNYFDQTVDDFVEILMGGIVK